MDRASVSPPDDSPRAPARDLGLLARLLSRARPYLFVLSGALAAIVGHAALQLVPPYLAKVAIDSYLPARDLAGIDSMVVLLLIALVGSAVLEAAQSYILQLTAQRILFGLRVEVFGHLLGLDAAFHDRNRVGRLMTRVTNDVEVLNDFFTSGAHAVFFDFFTLAGIVIVLVGLDWRLAIVTFLVVPVIVLISNWFRRHIRDAYRDVRAWLGRMNAVLQESIAGMTTVQLFRGERAHYERFSRLNAGHRDSHLGAVFYYAVFYPAIEVIATVATALVVWTGGLGVAGGSLTLGTLVAFLLYAQRFFRPIADVSEKLNAIQGALAAAERIFDLLDTPPGMARPAHPAARPATARGRSGRITFDRVSFAYDGRNAVIHDVSFEVLPGEHVGIVGATGSGKSTLVNLLLRFYDVTGGRVLVDGIDVREMDLKELRSIFGLVLQDVHLFSRSVNDNIRFGNDRMSDAAVRRAAEAVRAAGFIERLPGGFDSPVAERGATLSAGEKQLLSFARAFACDPSVLVLDEATSNVDVSTERLVEAAIQRLTAGRTTIAIAHRLSTIREMDRILVMHKGEIREQGTHEELLRRGGLYSGLYRLQGEEGIVVA